MSCFPFSCVSGISYWIIYRETFWVTFHPFCELMLPVWDHCSWRDLILLLLHLIFGYDWWWALSSFFCWVGGLVAVKSWGFSCIAICRLNLPFPPLMMWLSFESISSLWWNNWGCNLRSLSKRDIYSPCSVFLHRGYCRKPRLCMGGVALRTRNHLIVLCR